MRWRLLARCSYVKCPPGHRDSPPDGSDGTAPDATTPGHPQDQACPDCRSLTRTALTPSDLVVLNRVSGQAHRVESMLQGAVDITRATMNSEDRIERARSLYERAVLDGDASGLETADRDLNAVEADLAVARGQILHARFFDEGIEDPGELALFERASELYQMLGDERGEGESLFWQGCFHQVVRHDDAAAAPALNRSRELAMRVDDKRTLAEALRHLGIAEHRAGRLDAARDRLEESARLRREIDLMPGVAANLVGLVYIAAAQGHRHEALAMAEEARAIAKASGAHRILAQVEEARSSLESS